MSVPRYRRYPGYKDSGIGWMGEIPEHWGPVPLYAKYEIALGKMLDSGRATGEHTVPYLRNVDVQWDSVHVEDLPKMDIPPVERERYRIRSGDLLVCEGGEVGRSAIWREELGECYYQKALHRVRPHATDEDPRFLFYVLYSLAKLGVFAASGNQNTIDHLTAVQLRHYRFPHPPLVEQGLIAAFLDRETAKIDALVAKKERLLELLEEKRAALVTRAVTRGLDPEARLKDSGVQWLGCIPDHWQVWRSKRLFLRRADRAGAGDEQLTASQEYGVIPQKDFMLREGRRVVQVVTGTEILRRVEANDFVISMRSFQGGIEWSQFSGAISSAYVPLIPTDRVYSRFFAYLLKSSRYIQALQSTSNLVRDGQALRYENFCLVDLPLPPLSEQRSIAAFLHDETQRISTLTATIQVAIGHLKEYRTALIAAAVTGKIDVREEVA